MSSRGNRQGKGSSESRVQSREHVSRVLHVGERLGFGIVGSRDIQRVSSDEEA